MPTSSPRSLANGLLPAGMNSCRGTGDPISNRSPQPPDLRPPAHAYVAPAPPPFRPGHHRDLPHPPLLSLLSRAFLRAAPYLTTRRVLPDGYDRRQPEQAFLCRHRRELVRCKQAWMGLAIPQSVRSSKERRGLHCYRNILLSNRAPAISRSVETGINATIRAMRVNIAYLAFVIPFCFSTAPISAASRRRPIKISLICLR